MKRTISTQLKQDFGEFPPQGLVADNFTDFEFYIKDSLFKKLKSLPKDLKNILSEVLHALRSDEELMQSNATAKASLEQAKAEFMKLQDDYGSLAYYSFCLLMILLSPFIILFVVVSRPKRVYNIIFNVISAITNICISAHSKNFAEKNVLGHVSRFAQDTVNIHVYKKKQKERTISHEALHLLQYRHIRESEDELFRTPILCDVFPNIKDEFSEYQNYLSNRFELEVVLHEVIRNHYESHLSLPKTLEDFKELMGKALNDSLSDQSDRLGDKLVTLASLCIKNYKNTPSEEHDGSTEFVRQARRIVLEWLAPCYANLLQYYGDEKASRAFKSQIMGPNLYNRVYRCPH
ncbi:hypothetical protein AB4342_12495 [Vibrio breoganii]|uniref:hypothetical protein n=1 Tax=Vibrio breoganii TaxID=553239 RepID=UPI000C83CF85|nr:hypothetical protein [Vibrio breoganii]PMJ44292.1 hypothetical protein BCU21_16090 [Vibrio breoganii]PMK59415.1 hypothetical protein BCT97_06400 [Vibrio breoganii]PMM86760.1 hypothetical protein BCT45_05610 [Vibrio breoganii]PMO29214.1 hypothetical protein BCT14_06575 [Vibrio breoganii]PMO32950.1 hypothetical protein BCT13_08620 [Vibrio breoganii]